LVIKSVADTSPVAGVAIVELMLPAQLIDDACVEASAHVVD
jgi:hypothetical protein